MAAIEERKSYDGLKVYLGGFPLVGLSKEKDSAKNYLFTTSYVLEDKNKKRFLGGAGHSFSMNEAIHRVIHPNSAEIKLSPYNGLLSSIEYDFTHYNFMSVAEAPHIYETSCGIFSHYSSNYFGDRKWQEVELMRPKEGLAELVSSIPVGGGSILD